VQRFSCNKTSLSKNVGEGLRAIDLGPMSYTIHDVAASLESEESPIVYCLVLYQVAASTNLRYQLYRTYVVCPNSNQQYCSCTPKMYNATHTIYDTYFLLLLRQRAEPTIFLHFLHKQGDAFSRQKSSEPLNKRCGLERKLFRSIYI